MRTIALTMALAATANAGEVVVEVRKGPPVEGALPRDAPLRVETRYGALSIPASHLLSLDPKEGLVRADAGVARGALGWTDLVVTTRYGEARLPLKDVVKVTWKRARSVPEAKHHVGLADGTSLGGAITPADFDFETAYGTLRIPFREVQFLARQEDGILLRLRGMTVRGEPRVECWTVETAYGVLRVPCGDLVRLATRPIPMEGDRLEDECVVRTVGAHGGSTYALVVREQQMTWAEARDLANALGGHLATVRDEAENAFLYRLAARAGPQVHAWIGFSDDGHEGDWRWVTDEPVLHASWNGGEPNNAGGRENHCELVVDWNGRWNDADGRTRRVACLVEFDADGP
jgi:hypothetical protein